MNTTKSSATQVEAQDVVGLDPLAAALAKIERLTAENEARRRNMRETFDAMCAMRNSINEHLPMPSLESDLLQGPEDSIFCAAVAEAVVSALTVARAERDAALASSARAVVMGVWGMCEAIEDDAHEKIAMADCDHSKGFWTGQKLAAKTIRRSTEMPAQTTSTVQDALAVRVKVKSLVWCDGCRAVGAIHCSDPENCGYMVSAEAAADSWKAWLDDLPLPEDFAVGIGRLGDFIDRIVANAIVEPPSQPITVQDAAQVPEIAALIKAAKDRDGGSHDEDCRIHRKYREPVHCNCGHDDLDAALRAIAEQDPKK